jgi:hypothetical protein
MSVTTIRDIRFNFGKFDAELNREAASEITNAKLTLILKVCLKHHEQISGTVSDGNSPSTPLRVGSWPPLEWNSFKEIYQRECQEFWDNRFMLRPPFYYDGLNILLPENASYPDRPETGFRSYRPKVDCRFKLQLCDSEGSSHIVIKVMYLIPRRGMNSFTHRSDSLTYDSADLAPSPVGFDNSRTPACFMVTHHTHIHEVGHALGLEHVGVSQNIASCIRASNHNELICYGDDINTINNVMGWGTRLSWHEAEPWRHAMFAHTRVNSNAWEIIQK